MLTIAEITEKVKEDSLSNANLEKYRDALVELLNMLQEEYANLEKAHALFLEADPEEAVTRAERKWNAKPEGQRMIELKHTLIAGKRLLSALKDKIYRII